jgi:hypothetical protein
MKVVDFGQLLGAVIVILVIVLVSCMRVMCTNP